MFSAALQRSGSPVSSDTPAEPDPRNWGQFFWAFAAPDPRIVIKSRAAVTIIIAFQSLVTSRLLDVSLSASTTRKHGADAHGSGRRDNA
jgi:hypothetical protein